MTPTATYTAFVAAVDRRIRSLRWTMQDCDDRSGNQDGYSAKMLHPEKPSGRQANWESLDRLLQALYPGGFRVTIKPLKNKMLTQVSIAKNGPTPPRKAAYVPTPEKAREMNEIRNKSLSSWQRKVIARRAARRRWRDKRLLQLQMKTQKQISIDTAPQMRALTPTQSR